MANCRRWADVAHAHDAAVHRRKKRAERRADHSGNTADTHECAGHQRPRRTGGNHGGDVVAVPQENDALHHGGVALEPHHVRGLLITADHFGSMLDFQTGGVVLLALQALAKDGLVSGEDEVQVRVGGQGTDSGFYRSFGAVVAAEAVNDDLDHRGFT